MGSTFYGIWGLGLVTYKIVYSLWDANVLYARLAHVWNINLLPSGCIHSIR